MLNFKKEVDNWIKLFESKNYKILDYPRAIEESQFMDLYPNIHTEFLKNTTQTDTLFIMNED